jgi:ribose 5-phosphate isomerase A
MIEMDAGVNSPGLILPLALGFFGRVRHGEERKHALSLLVMGSPMSMDELKKAAAAEALTLVESGMRLGLGTGSTAKIFVDLLAERMKREGLKLIAVPTSEATRQQAEALGIPLTTLDETPELDLAIDGADELDADLNLIKGGGAAHLREKIVELSAKRFVVIADETKQVKTLGKFPLPLEVVPFGLEATKARLTRAIESAGSAGELRLRLKADGSIVKTDGGNIILDAHLGVIKNPAHLAETLDHVTGLVEHGLFIGMAERAYLATREGVRVIKRA